jgi:hypothetical protein
MFQILTAKEDTEVKKAYLKKTLSSTQLGIVKPTNK